MGAGKALVGLDIGTSGIRAVQVKRRKDGTYEIVKAASVELPRGSIRNGVVADPGDPGQCGIAGDAFLFCGPGACRPMNLFI